MARLRAVVMIQPAGLGGSPSCGHRRVATAKASWTASSATSMSPKTRTRTATARPYSSRKTRSTSAAPAIRPAPRRAGGPRSAASSPPRSWPAHSSAASRSSAAMIVKPPTCSLPSTKGPSVMTTSPPLARTTVAAGRGGQAAAEHPAAGLLEVVADGPHVALDPVDVDVLGQGPVGLVDGEHVLLHGCPPGGWFHPLHERRGPRSTPLPSRSCRTGPRSTAWVGQRHRAR